MIVTDSLAQIKDLDVYKRQSQARSRASGPAIVPADRTRIRNSPVPRAAKTSRSAARRSKAVARALRAPTRKDL